MGATYLHSERMKTSEKKSFAAHRLQVVIIECVCMCVCACLCLRFMSNLLYFSFGLVLFAHCCFLIFGDIFGMRICESTKETNEQKQQQQRNNNIYKYTTLLTECDRLSRTFMCTTYMYIVHALEFLNLIFLIIFHNFVFCL